MSEPIIELGENSEIDEDSNGDTVIRNTLTGTSITLTDFIDVVGGGFGDSDNRVSESFFESLDATSGTIDTLTSTDGTIETIEFTDTAEDPQEIDPATGTVDIDLTEGNYYSSVAATEDIEVNLTNPSTDPGGNFLTVLFEDGDDMGPYTITYDDTVLWPGGDVRDEIPEEGNLWIMFVTPDGGTTWYGLFNGENFE